jgi:hypothetical protein
MQAETSHIKQKLAEFIRKYYLQKLVFGALATLLQLTIIFFIINYTEYYFWLDKTPRTFIFIGWWLAFSTLVYIQTVNPFIKYLGWGKRMSQEQAAQIIGIHFSEIQDKLLNLLQLESMQDKHTNEFILKSIEQKTANLTKFSFSMALDWQRFKKQTLRFSALLFVLIAWGIYEAPKMKAASYRWWNFSEKFVKKAPFNFHLLNQDLNIAENETVEVKLKINGKQLPTSAFLLFEGQKIQMKNEGNQVYSYILNQVKSSSDFAFLSAGFESEDFHLLVNKLPKWKNVALTITYPEYTQIPQENVSPYDIIKVPEGSRLSWIIHVDDATELRFLQNNSWKSFAANSKEIKLTTFANRYDKIKAFLKGNVLTLKDTFQTIIEPIQDAYPDLNIETQQDSSYENLWYFSGSATDDYGIVGSQFVYRILSGEQDLKAAWKSVPLKVNPSQSIEIVHMLNTELLGMKPQQILEYYFVAYDNDGLHGSKAGKTAVQRIVKKSVDAYRQETIKNKQNLQDKMMQSQQSSKKILDESKKLQEEFQKSSKMNFDNQSKIQNWIEKQEQQIKEMKKIYEQQKKIDREQKELKLNDPELEQRRDKIEKELKQLQNPDLQKLLDQLKELLDKNAPKEQLENKMKSIDKLQRENEKEMEKLMEQLKELQLEEAVKDQAKQMDEWAKKEEELAKKTEKSGANQKEELLKELEAQNQKLAEIEKQTEQIDKQNKALENPMKLDLGQKEQKEAKSESENAQKDLQKGKEKEAAKKEKSAAQKMKEAKEKMEESLKKEEEKRLAEDHDMLRALLENLIDISHRQEKVFTELKTLKEDNPRLLALNKAQISLKELSNSIEDSLMALAKRQPMISSLVTKEIGRVNDNIASALDNLKVRNIQRSAMHEQYVMTGYNNLSVMLMESLKEMNQKMSSQKNSKSNSNKSCNNPNSSGQSGKGKPKKGGKLSEAQRELGEMLQKMQSEGKGKGQGGKKEGQGKPQSGDGKDGKSGDQGNKDGNGKDGNGKEGGNRELSKELAQMALMQEALRRQIAELKKGALKEGNVADAQKLAEAEKMMEQQEKDLVNGKLDPKTLQRHKDILTRLLEHEKAQMKQGDEEQRKSNRGEQMPSSIPLDIIERNKLKMQEKELLRRSPANMNPYYKEKVDEYLRGIGN